MKPFIVVSDGFDKSLFNQLVSIADLEVHPKSKVTPEELEKLLPRINGLVIRSATTVTSDLLEKAPQLKYVIRAGEGTDNIDKVACQKKGVKVSNTPGSNSNSAAEQAIALMMTVLRKTAFAHASIKAGKWEKALFNGNELWKKTVGFVGFGKIAQIVAQRISGFEPRVLFYDPVVKQSSLSYAKQAATLDEVFKNSDIVTIHVPLAPKTKDLVNQTYLEMMKPDAILINCARGGIVNEDDLYVHLKEKNIKGAGFDVFKDEPLPANSKLLSLDNLVMTPHLGASTDEAQLRVGEMAMHQLQEFFLKNNLLNEVRA